jgi:hypothetical protein
MGRGEWEEGNGKRGMGRGEWEEGSGKRGLGERDRERVAQVYRRFG